MRCSIEDADRFCGEEAEEAAGEIEAAVGASWALIHNSSLSCLTVICHSNRLETVRPGISSAKLGSVQRDDKVTRGVVFSASTKADIIKGPSRARETLMQFNVSGLAFGDLLVTAAMDRTVGRGAKHE